MSYLDKRREHILNDRPLPPKKVYGINKINPKRAEKEKQRTTVIVKPKKAGQFDADKVDGEQEQTEKEKWFALIRTKLVGTCQCGCGQKSQKKDDMYFKSSCCHLFPKKTFKSIMYNEFNYLERAFWGGCHTNLDEQSMDKWVNMADWEDIKAKFYKLSPLLSDKERATKFYSKLEFLVSNN